MAKSVYNEFSYRECLAFNTLMSLAGIIVVLVVGGLGASIGGYLESAVKLGILGGGFLVFCMIPFGLVARWYANKFTKTPPKAS